MTMDPSAPVIDKRRELAVVAKAVSTCTACGLCRERTNAVPGEGNPEASIVFVGEGPGFYEDQQGRPFVGASGKFLDELLRSIGMDRKTVFITNVVKCRPPGNRDPQPDEIEACGKHLEAQLAAIGPKVVVTLGRHSMQRYFPGESIGRIHGQPRRKGDVIVVPMYHPAAALHQGSLRKVIEADFMRLPEFLKKTLSPADSPGAEAKLTERIPAHLRTDAARQQDSRKAADAPSTATPVTEPQEQMRLL
jgi:uracil-DNA glycosylase family 4